MQSIPRGSGRDDFNRVGGRFHEGMSFTGMPQRFEEGSFMSGLSGGSDFRNMHSSHGYQIRSDNYHRRRENYSPPRERPFLLPNSNDIPVQPYISDDYHDHRREVMRYQNHALGNDEYYYHQGRSFQPPTPRGELPPSYQRGLADDYVPERLQQTMMPHREQNRYPRGSDDFVPISRRDSPSYQCGPEDFEPALIRNESSPIRETLKQRQISPPNNKKDVKIEIFPGTFARLRGAEETLSAIDRDFIMPCDCFVCSKTIYCIKDAEYVLCPTCRVVCPMEGGVPDKVGGVGLGLTSDDLTRHQEEIDQNSIRRERGARKALKY